MHPHHMSHAVRNYTSFSATGSGKNQQWTLHVLDRSALFRI